MPIVSCAHDRVGHSALCSSAVPARATHVPLYARAARAADGVLTTGATPCVRGTHSVVLHRTNGRWQRCRWCQFELRSATEPESTLERGID